jgi:hypothetical protein
MAKDKKERKHRKTHKNPAAQAVMAGANFDAVPPLADVLSGMWDGISDEQRADLKRRGLSGPFPELTPEENNTVFRARLKGYASFFPAYPSAEAQARSTLAGAVKWLKTH